MKVHKKTLSEDKLIEAIKIKSREGAVALYDMYSKNLYGIIEKILINKEIAEDVCQETFIRIWTSFDKYDASKGRLFTWMSCVARNMAKDALRSKLYQQYLNSSPIELHFQEIEHRSNVTFNTDTLGMKLWTANLNADQKHIVDLIYYKGYTQNEVADELNIPLGTVKTRCRMGVMQLRAIYGDLNNGRVHDLTSTQIPLAG